MTSGLRRFAKHRVVILSAPNGARRSQQDHPSLPVTASELAENAAALQAEGVSVLHLHVRDDDGKHTLDADKYREAIAAIRERVGESLVLQVTTEAVGIYGPAEQMAVVRELQPEAVSIALKELCPGPDDEPAFADFCRWMREAGVWPQFILYSVEDVQRFDAMRKRGVFADDAPFVLFVLGNYANAVAGTVADLDALLEAADTDAYPWAVCCFGPNENAVMRAALDRGGHVRIGFENNVVLANGTPAADNAALIREFVAGTAEHERSPAAPDEVRQAFAERFASVL